SASAAVIFEPMKPAPPVTRIICSVYFDCATPGEFYALVAEASHGPGTLQAMSARLVFVNRYFHPDQSATSRMLSDLAFRLAARGVSVAVVTSRQLYEDPHAALPSRETVNGVDVYRVATATRGRSRLLG